MICSLRLAGQQFRGLKGEGKMGGRSLGRGVREGWGEGWDVGVREGGREGGSDLGQWSYHKDRLAVKF